MEDAVIALDSTVRSQHSSHSKESKDSANSESKPDSCLESKHSKDVLIPEKQRQQQQQHHQPRQRVVENHRQDHRLPTSEAKDDSNLLMFTSCGQLLLGKLTRDCCCAQKMISLMTLSTVSCGVHGRYRFSSGSNNAHN